MRTGTSWKIQHLRILITFVCTRFTTNCAVYSLLSVPHSSYAQEAQDWVVSWVETIYKTTCKDCPAISVAPVFTYDHKTKGFHHLLPRLRAESVFMRRLDVFWLLHIARRDIKEYRMRGCISRRNLYLKPLDHKNMLRRSQSLKVWFLKILQWVVCISFNQCVIGQLQSPTQSRGRRVIYIMISRRPHTPNFSYVWNCVLKNKGRMLTRYRSP